MTRFYFFTSFFYPRTAPLPLNTNDTTHPPDSEIASMNEKFQEKLAILKALNPFAKEPQVFQALSDDALKSEKENFLPTFSQAIKSNLSKPTRQLNWTRDPITDITYTSQMLYALHITKEMEKRKLVIFTKEQVAIIEEYENCIKRKYSIYFNENF
jgi:hypothetical protein